MPAAQVSELRYTGFAQVQTNLYLAAKAVCTSTQGDVGRQRWATCACAEIYDSSSGEAPLAK